MSDLEDELRGLFRDKEQQSPTARSLSEYVSGAGDTVGRRRRRWQWGVVPAAVLVSAAVVVGVAALSNQSGTPVPVSGDPAGDDVHGPLASGAAVSCFKEYSPREVAHRSFAFDGIVTEIGPGTTNREGEGQLRLSSVTFAVNEWFSGGSTESATVDMLPPTPDGTSAETGQSYDVGTRLLVSGEPRWGGVDPLADAIAWDTCGFTRYWDQETADAWRAAVSATASTDVLVEDIENPSAVVRRARELLGDRFVDVSINDDHTSYIVGVLNLTPEEMPSLGEELSGPAPVTVAFRAVSAEAIADLRTQIEQLIKGLDSSVDVTLIGSNEADGSVLVGVSDDEGVIAAAAFLRSQLPQWQVTDRGAHSIRLATGSPSDPQVLIRVISVSDGAYNG